MQDDFSEHKKLITSAISSGFVHKLGSASGISILFGGVSIMFGLIAFTLIFKLFSSSAIVSVILITALFAQI